jgi:uncharacterized protein YjbJ (UPF0337 family)
MNWNQVEGNWKEFTGKVKETWGNLTDDELDKIAGKRDVLVGQIQKKYGIAQDAAEKQVKDFEVQVQHSWKEFTGKVKENVMNWNQVEGNWKEFTGKVKETWGKLTDDELDQIAGKRDILVGQIQKKYGLAQEAAEKQVKEFETTHKFD